MTQKNRNVRIAAVFFCATLLLLLTTAWGFHQAKLSIARQELVYLAINTGNKVTKLITDLIWKTETLAALIVRGHGQLDDFDKIAAILVNDYAIRNVSLAPDGIVDRVFPVRGNEDVVGLDYLNSGGGRESQTAKMSGKLTLAGPFDLVQGGQALTGRLPIYLHGEEGRMFWGFVSIALNYPEVLQGAYLDELYQQGFAGEIWRIHPDTGQRQTIWKSQGPEMPKEMATREIQLFNVLWHIDVGRVPGPYEFVETLAYGVGLLFISLLMGLLCYHYLELRAMKSAMENMALTDALTGLPNRRNLMQQLRQILQTAAKKRGNFILLYLDLNGFKQVNDIHGHEKGDYVLITSAKKMLEALDGQGIVARVGGDEFIILLEDFTLGERLDALVHKLDKALVMEITGANSLERITVSSSFGVAAYPDDGTELEALLHHADQTMYEEKKARKLAEGDFKPHFR